MNLKLLRVSPGRLSSVIPAKVGIQRIRNSEVPHARENLIAPRLLSKLLLLAFATLAGCAVGPDYKRPEAPVTDQFKEAGDWKQAEPRDLTSKANWWEVFGDSALNELEAQVNISNQNVKVAEAQYQQARALVRSARANYYPTITAQAGATKSDFGTGVAKSGTSTGTATGTSVSSTGRSYSATADVSWELDIWGRLRRATESNITAAQASEADLKFAQLSAQAELATDYFNLQVAMATKDLLERTVDAYQETVRLTTNRYNAGVVGRSDVVQAQVQLKSAQAELIDVESTRAIYEHAIAVLVGKAPAQFKLPEMPAVQSPPDIPLALPSQVIEQRPDVSAAERRVASANAEIGVARAAFFPQLTLSATGGYRNSSTVDLFSLPNRFWSIGPALAETIFDGGARRAESARVRAAYDQSVAQYRQTVLSGFQEVEDNLSTIRVLNDEAQVEDEAVQLARESVRLMTNQYKAGTVAYLDVVTTQATLYANERTALALQGRRFTASVALIKALGGGWDESELKKP